MTEKKKSVKRAEKRVRWTAKEISLVKEMGFALAKKLHRSPASVGIKFYNLTAPGRAKYFAKLKAKKSGKKSKAHKVIARKPMPKKKKIARSYPKPKPTLPRTDITTLPPITFNASE